MRRGAAIAGLAIALLVSACSDAGHSSPGARTTPTSLPSGLVLGCTDRYQSEWSEGPIESGQYVHYVCENGKVTSWWIDDNSAVEQAPPA
jgi:hypothetical protein